MNTFDQDSTQAAGELSPKTQTPSDAWSGPTDAAKSREIVELHRTDVRWNLVAFLFVGMWIASAWLMYQFPSWPIRLACYAVIGTALHALAILMHEAIHGNFFRHPWLDRWAGFIFGAPALFSATAYKTTHSLHHQYNRTSKDPDEFTNLTPRRRLLAVAFFAWGIIGLLVYLIHVPLTAILRGNRKQRRNVLVEYVLLLGLYSAVVLMAHRFDRLDVVLNAWVIPMAFAAILGNLRGWAEHTMTRAGHPLTQTRTVTSNALVSLLMCNLNYHLEHHLYPGVPWYHLPKVHRLLEEDYRRAGAIVYRSYLRFLWDALRIGVHGTASGSGFLTRPDK